MTIIGHGVPPQQWLSDDPSPAEITEIITFLEKQGTFEFPVLSTGLFSAAAAANPEFGLTGYQNVWVRDNIHVAHALWKLGETEKGARPVAALLEFFAKHRHKFDAVLDGTADISDSMQRPHIRFDGESLTENSEKWSHAQNDALGYLVWLSTTMALAGDFELNPDRLEVVSLIIRYLGYIEYWQDEDNGHWEETKKIEASSIGPVVAGLKSLKAYLSENAIADTLDLDRLIAEGEQALAEILPAECIQDDPELNRRYDSALLFLAYPLNVVDDEMTLQIVNDVRENLMGPIGIRRYVGDSYWCANYRDLLSAERRTTDFSDNTSERDALLKAGEEAQWCIFDPIVSVIFGERYRKSGDQRDRELQVQHLKRSLAQLTTAESRFPAYRCPESYFLEHGEWIPNDITPLLWTQANLRLALEAFLVQQ